MRIALVTSEFSGLPHSGGIGTYFLELAKCLADSGHAVEVFTSGKQGDLSPIGGVKLHHLGPHHSPEFALMAARAVSKRHAEVPFDVIECGELKAEGILAAKSVPDAAFVVRVHSPSVILDRYLDFPPALHRRLTAVFWQITSLIGAWRRGLPLQPIRLEPFAFPWNASCDVEERNAAAAADLLLVMNRQMREFAIHHWWISSEVIDEVPNPIVTKSYQSADLCSDKPPILGFLGRLEPRKGIVELAKALVRILPDFPTWRVEIAGGSMPSCISGSDAGEIARTILKPFSERVSFVGAVAPEKVPEWFSRMELCVFPSLWETFSYVALEAASCGRAIVATNTGAIPQILDGGRVGEIVPPGNVRALAEAIRRMMGDSSHRREMGKAAREHVLKHFNEERVTGKILKAYGKALLRRDRRLASEQGRR